MTDTKIIAKISRLIEQVINAERDSEIASYEDGYMN